MLVLSRKRGEEVVLTLPDGTRVVVLVVAVEGEKVRLGFVAPRSAVEINRREVQDRLDAGERRDGYAD